MADTQFSTVLSFQPKPNAYQFIDWQNRVVGLLTVLGYAGNREWFCKCKCGIVIKVKSSYLSVNRPHHGHCPLRIQRRGGRKTHGEAHKTPEWAAYARAKNRCNNPTNASYPRYGGRGIEFLFNSYEEFLNDIGRRPTPQHSLDRIDNSKNYEKGNVQWATAKQQAQNTRQTRLITVNGETRCISSWARKINVSQSAICRRLNHYGWCCQCSILPKGSNCPHKIIK
jgi:hypothetical protein